MLKYFGPIRRRYFGGVTGRHEDTGRKLLGELHYKMELANLSQMTMNKNIDGSLYRLHLLVDRQDLPDMGRGEFTVFGAQIFTKLLKK